MHKTAPKSKENCKICGGKGYHKLSCSVTKIHIIIPTDETNVSDQPKI